MTPEDYIEEAIRLAMENVELHGGGPFGALIVKNGVILAKEANQVRLLKDPTADAVVLAIRAACQKLGTHLLTGCDIYCSSEPCPMGMGAVYWSRASRLYYASTRQDAAMAGLDHQKIMRDMIADGNHRLLEVHHVENPWSLSALKAWKKVAPELKY